jgi:hypothetical protein
MTHIKAISKPQDPARAESLLVWQQKAAIFSTVATGLGVLATGFGTWVEATEVKGADAE